MKTENTGPAQMQPNNGKADGVLRPNAPNTDMARGMDPFKELNARQTHQFLANLSDPSHIQRSQQAIERVRKMRFVVIE